MRMRYRTFSFFEEVGTKEYTPDMSAGPPDGPNQMIDDWLDHKYTQGWEFVSWCNSGSTATFRKDES